MKAFVIYTVLRLALFAACYALFGVLYYVVIGQTGLVVWPFLAAIIVSSLLSLKLLTPQRERFAASVEARASKAAARFEERRAKEDVD